MSTPQVKAITDRQEMEKHISKEIIYEDRHDPDYLRTYISMILNQEGWYYVNNSPCTCPNGGEQGHNLTCGYYFKGIVR